MDNPLDIILVGGRTEHVRAVCERLRAAGHRLLAQLDSAEGLLYRVERHRPDLLLIDMGAPDPDLLEGLAVLDRQAPIPVALFASGGDADFIGRALASGVSAYMAEGISAERVQTAIVMALARFRQLQQLRESLARARQQLDDRKAIERAKGLLMAKKELGEAAAHKTLRSLAMRSNTTMREVAEQIIQYFQAGH